MKDYKRYGKEEFLTAKDVVEALKKRVRLIIASILTFTFITAVFVFFISTPKYEASVKLFAGKTEEVQSDYSDKVIKNMGPIDFISYIKNAEFVISNSFHGTAFSIIFEKQFAVVNRKEAINTRMRDLLSILKIENRLISENYNFNNLINDVDYKEVNKYLRERLEVSKTYLDRVTSIKNQLEDFNEEENIICN